MLILVVEVSVLRRRKIIIIIIIIVHTHTILHHTTTTTTLNTTTTGGWYMLTNSIIAIILDITVVQPLILGLGLLLQWWCVGYDLRQLQYTLSYRAKSIFQRTTGKLICLCIYICVCR